MQDRRFISVSEMATELGIHEQTAYLWISHGRLPVVRLSARCLRVDRRDLEALLEKRKHRAAAR